MVYGYIALLLGTLLIFLSFLGVPLRFPRVVLLLGGIFYGLYVYHAAVLALVRYALGPHWGGLA